MFNVNDFIELVKARPSLYNSYANGYTSREHHKILWKEIADELDSNSQQCRTIWTSLRSSYARHLQNMENNEKGINRKKKAKWYLADKMSFLNDFMSRTPKDRNITLDPNDSNFATTVSGDDNSMFQSFSNFDYKNENINSFNGAAEDNQSIVTIKSEDLESQMTLSSHSLEDRIIQVADYGNNVENENEAEAKETQLQTQSPEKSYRMKKCRVQLSSRDQNILTPKRTSSVARPRESPKKDQGPIPKRLKMSSPATIDLPKFTQPMATTTTTTTMRDEKSDIKARENSTLLFFESILYDLRRLPDRKLRLFKQDILQDLNKYLDEDENED
ncbi:uncharacterized protein LOC129942154 isoform X2 [Eupeodes corollae]|uniref:uncharacterized protein LOC129942154 isoform X2 n=1 Tax=Eupeodes corollae TaxID=290404 RepID=UPI0024923BDA|nr:uncharacterized protein LOC129942154 isoform X2 [Eupeodes corollae]